MQSSRGSAQVEAALIIPLTVLIIVGMVKLSVSMYGRVTESSQAGSAAAELLSDGGLVPVESVLRGRWHIK